MKSKEIASLVEKYPWWSEARLHLARQEGDASDVRNRLIARLHPLATISQQQIDVKQLTRLTDDDLIERFLRHGNYRIVADEGEADDMATPEIEDAEDMVSEELAEIYLNQGLYMEAIEIYRKLSLLNSEKSIYFAELIAKIEDKIEKK